MKISFSPKTKLIKVAEDEGSCRLCSTPSTKNVGSLPVIPYSLSGEPTANKIRRKEVPGCSNCNSTGKITAGSPTFSECKTCKPGAITPGRVGQGPGLIKPSTCPTCYNRGVKVTPVHGGAIDETEERPCPTCNGNQNNIPVKECPSCAGSDKPGFVQTGESKHDVICPTCNGSKKRIIASPYTPILQVKCPHLSGTDTFTKPNVEGASDELGPYDNNYFEGQRLLPLKLLWKIRGVESKYKHQSHQNLPKFNGTTREVGMLTPPVHPIQSSKEPSYLDFFSKTELLDPDSQRTASKFFKRIIASFNSKTAKPNESEESNSSNSETSDNELGDEFFGRTEGPNDSSNIKDFLPEGLALAPLTPSRRTLTPEQNKRLHGGPVTVRQVDESDMTRPFLKNPAKALEKTKTMLRGQKSLSEKRSTMSKMFKGINDLETSLDNEPDEQVKAKKRNDGLIPTYRGWRDNLQTVSENLDVFGQLRGALKKKLSPVIGKNMDPEIATALASQVMRDGRKSGGVDLSQHRMGITEPMPYFKNDENWREVHNGLGCDHDPGDGHEPDVGCMIDYHNPADNPREGVTTGTNSRLVTGKYTTPNGKTVLQTVGARLKRPMESGLAKQDLRGSTPSWTPENFGRVVELPADRATCVPNKIQREHYVVNHTVEPPTEKAEYTSLPSEETGVPGLKPEPVLAKEKIKFPEEIRQGGPKESVYVGNPLYQLNNPFSTQEVEHGMWANNPVVQHFAKQIKNGQRPEKFKPYIPEPKFNSQQMKTRPGLTGPPAQEEGKGLDIDGFDLDSMFDSPEETPPKTSKRGDNALNPVEENADDTYDTDKKLKVQKMQRTQVHMVEPSNPSAPDITPDVPQIDYN
jgi:hypothetical protein